MRAQLSRLTIGLAVWITAAVSLAVASGAYLYSVRHTDRLVTMARDGALAQSTLIRSALEHAMLEDDSELIEKMITTFGREPAVVGVMLLDRRGVVQFSSGPLEPGDALDIKSPTCQACHRQAAAERLSSRVLDTRGGAVLRTVVPLRNEPKCHDCHDPAEPINGVLVADLDAGAIAAASNRDLGWLVAVSGALTLLLLSAIGLVIRQVVVRRLQRFEVAARQIAQGDLTRRVPDGGSDIISWLGREFNVMAESVSHLIGEVRSERERLETVLDSIDDGIVVLDASRTVVAANQAFIRRSGIVREQLFGCSCRRAGAGACCAMTDCPTLACLQSGTRQVRICERRQPDGSSVWEEVHASPIAGLPGAPVHVVEVWRDISDRRTAEARLAESHRLASLGLLASGFSHEMNTPLGTVLACVEGILRDAKPGGAVDREYVRDRASTAREQVMRCRGITEQFLRLARGQHAPAEIVVVDDAVAAAVRLIQPTARARGVDIQTSSSEANIRIRAEYSDLQQALINLLLNAIQACREGGLVRVDTGRGGTNRSRAVIRISDNGCGIAPEHRARIFEPFFSVRADGTGLGLFLALNFARRSGGELFVDSAPGQGSTFSLALPVVGVAAGTDAGEAVPA